MERYFKGNPFRYITRYVTLTSLLKLRPHNSSQCMKNPTHLNWDMSKWVGLTQL